MIKTALLVGLGVGVGYLVFCQVAKSKKKCPCQENSSSTAAAPPEQSAAQPATTNTQQAASSSGNLNADGFNTKLI